MTLEVQRRAAAHPAPRHRRQRGRSASSTPAHHAIGARRLVLLRGPVRPRHRLPARPARRSACWREDELVLVDTGCRVQGYNSDITRTYAFGTVDARASATIWDDRTRGAGRRLRRGGARRAVRSGRRRRARGAGSAQGWGRTTACPACRTAPATASACRSTKPAYLVRGDRDARWRRACAFPTSR